MLLVTKDTVFLHTSSTPPSPPLTFCLNISPRSAPLKTHTEANLHKNHSKESAAVVAVVGGNFMATAATVAVM